MTNNLNYLCTNTARNQFLKYFFETHYEHVKSLETKKDWFWIFDSKAIFPQWKLPKEQIEVWIKIGIFIN